MSTKATTTTSKQAYKPKTTSTKATTTKSSKQADRPKKPTKCCKHDHGSIALYKEETISAYLCPE
eukprot:2131078-Ditylum_brightwellii.AAC.1